MGTVVAGMYEAQGSELIKSSAHLGWNSTVTAELYKHRQLNFQGFVQPQTEVIINISGTAHFRRRADGPEQQFVSRAGSASVCPGGVCVRYLHIDSGPLDMLHMHMPTDLFGTLRCTDKSAANSGLDYIGGLRDPLIQGIGFAVAEELMKASPVQTSRLLLDSFAVALAARLLQRYTRDDRENFTESYFDAYTGKGLDRLRLNRVLEFIHHHIDSDISLDELASIACFSVFHFCRSFKIATGQSPFQYISDARIRKVKALLTDQKIPINDIAVSTGFSSGANLARAFKNAVGVSPSEYRIKTLNG